MSTQNAKLGFVAAAGLSCFRCTCGSPVRKNKELSSGFGFPRFSPLVR